MPAPPPDPKPRPTDPLLPLRASGGTEAERAARRLLVSVGDIASLADKHPSAVSQWRKRPQDPFPEPVTGGRSPQFSAGEALRWLEENYFLPAGQPRPAWFWRQAVRALPGAADGSRRDQIRAFVASLVALGSAVHRGVEAAQPDPGSRPRLPTDADRLRKLAATIEHDHPRLRDLLVAGLRDADPDPEVLVVLVAALDQALLEPAGATTYRPAPSDLLDEALTLLGERSSRPTATQENLADLVAAIVAQRAVTHVLDPACGEAALLTRVGASCRPAPALLGTEIDPRTARIARIRLQLRHIEAEVHTIDAFRPGVITDGSFDMVVLDPPAGSGSGGPGRWLTLATNALTPDGCAAVAVPASSLRANASGAGVLRQRRVGAVVLLPPMVRHRVRDTQALTIITAAGGHTDILVVDLSHRRTTNPPLPFERIARLVHGWLDDPSEPGSLADFVRSTGLPAHVASTDDLLAGFGIGSTSPAPPPKVKETVLALRRLLDDASDLRGMEKLKSALDQFATAHRFEVEK